MCSASYILSKYSLLFISTSRMNQSPEIKQLRPSLVVQWLKFRLSMQGEGVPSLIWEDPLEEGKATHSNILAWEIPWAEGPDGVQSMGSQKSQT